MRLKDPMHVFEITTPGTWLYYEDREWSWQIDLIIDHLKDQFFEANAALNLFVQAASVPSELPTSPNRTLWESDARRHSEIQRQVEQELGGGFYLDNSGRFTLRLRSASSGSSGRKVASQENWNICNKLSMQRRFSMRLMPSTNYLAFFHGSLVSPQSWRHFMTNSQLHFLTFEES